MRQTLCNKANLSYRGAETLIQQAREWETSGEYARAIDCYIKVTDKVTPDNKILEKCWVQVPGVFTFSHYRICHTLYTTCSRNYEA